MVENFNVQTDSNGYKDDLISESSQRPSRDTYKEDNGIVEGASEEGIIAEQQTPHLLQNISSNTAYDRGKPCQEGFCLSFQNFKHFIQLCGF